MILPWIGYTIFSINDVLIKIESIKSQQKLGERMIISIKIDTMISLMKFELMISQVDIVKFFKILNINIFNSEKYLINYD